VLFFSVALILATSCFSVATIHDYPLETPPGFVDTFFQIVSFKPVNQSTRGSYADYGFVNITSLNVFRRCILVMALSLLIRRKIIYCNISYFGLLCLITLMLSANPSDPNN